ncbi:MAG: antitoxin Xre/MbcA/ParS toxin-binding domain-containing protein [Hydrogenophaga sp.]|uniref:type II RES/Xre toxin-antitoxin system antitoxin n=1 Tax=Hydrogenophaga sp. TaxID=1904254 RepID=UPI002731C8BB|nr:antitoxin Xre/MbcA/ParS toxin-binding domain-containing protein [Hydrogenophaga sp.]MDP2406866.1 DUF2384 domain-containing protein [Hydrogenophaga sp.]MDZ4174174.1 antitoxin Xre/MbcA/ParS toxin-binding domain-containing protein [Hydrogenophaga sp.]
MATSSPSATQFVADKKRNGARPGYTRHSARSALWDTLVNKTINLSRIEQHDMVRQGIPMSQLNNVLCSFTHLTEKEILNVLGVSKRTVQRHKSGVLRPTPSGALLDLIAVAQMATNVLGDRDAADAWLQQRCIAFEGRRPVELLSTRQGAALVKDHLIRMDYGVYV